MTAMTPRIALYEMTLRVLEVPARLRPSAIRCLTERVMDVFVTASTKLNMFSAPTKIMMRGSSSLGRINDCKCRDRLTYQGTIVTLKPTRAHTLRLVIVLTAISTRAVKVKPTRECTAFI